MITKAGVSADKVTVGISGYGRQFKMTDPSCSGSQCTYIGPEGKDTKGRCTNETAYISNAEIKEIIANNPSAKVVDSGGNSKFLIYDGNWVSFMDDKDQVARTNLWKSMNFGGTIEWAIDLNRHYHRRFSQGRHTFQVQDSQPANLHRLFSCTVLPGQVA